MLLLLSLALPAGATTGLVWQWPTEGHRYLLQARVDLPGAMWLPAERNAEARVVEVAVDLAVSCVPTSIGKRSVDVSCGILGSRLNARAAAADAGKLPPILDELDAKLGAATLMLEMSLDGRVRRVTLEGVPDGNQRQQSQEESLRLLLARALAGLDLQLPKNGDDKGKGQWTQSGALAMALPFSTGTLGSTALTHRVSAADGAVIDLVSSGRGVVSPGEAVMTSEQSAPTDYYELEFEGSARFDTAAGHLVSRTYSVAGGLTASSVSAEAGTGSRYVQQVHVEWLAPETPTPELGPNLELK